MHTTRHIRALVMLFALLCAGAAARAVEIRASIDPQQVFVGAQAVLKIEIVGADDAAQVRPPNPPTVPGLSIQFGGTSRISAPVMIINGRRQDTGPDKLVLQYAVTAAAPGRYIVPAFPVTVGSQTITTSPLVLLASDAPESDELAIVAQLMDTEVYEGQPATVQATVYYLNAKSASFTAGLPDSIELYPSVSPAEERAADVHDLEINGKPIRVAAGVGTYNNQRWKTLTFAYTLIPTRSGTFELPGPVATLDIITGQRGFGLFAENITERRIARAKPFSLTVKPLPIEGRPSDFSGLVGKFDVRTGASPTDVHVGEPIQLTMSITGPRPLQRINPPDLAAIPAFASNFKLSPEGWIETASSGSVGPSRVRDFVTTIRATSESVKEIPPIAFPYFDPERMEYRTASSRPIPLNIRETKQITAADAIGANGNGHRGFALPRVERVPLTPGSAGPTFAPIPARLRSQHLLLTEELRSPIIAAAVALPPLALAFSAIMVVRGRSHDPDRSRRRRELRRALARLGSSPTADQAADAVRAALADRSGLEAPTITAHDARRIIGPHDPDLAEETARVLLAADAGHFAGPASTPSSAGAPDPRAVLTRLAKVALQ